MAKKQGKPKLRLVPPAPGYDLYTFAEPLPFGLKSENCCAMTVNDLSLTHFGIYPGDCCLIELNGKPQSGDLAAFRWPTDNVGTTYVAAFYLSPGGRVRFEYSVNKETSVYVRKAEEVVIKGRVFRVERNGSVAHAYL